jgi:hypothetical protein
MLKKLTFSVVALAPSGAFAGGGGAADGGFTLLQSAYQMGEKLFSMITSMF